MQQNNPGGMDKRMLLAFALMIGIWIVYSQVMTPNSPPPPEPVATGQDVQSDPIATGYPSDPNDQPPAQPAAEDHGYGSGKVVREVDFSSETSQIREVVVDGTLVRAVFTTRGATLSSLTLKDFTSEEIKYLLNLLI